MNICYAYGNKIGVCMHKNNGFSVVSILILLVTIGVLALVGYYVYTKNSNSENAAGSNETTVTSQSTPKYTYTFPTNWGELKCDKQDTETNPAYQVVYPEDDKAVNCDDRDNVVLISRIVYPVDEKCSTLEEINKISEENGKPGYTSYECSEIVINGANVLVTSHTQPSVSGTFAVKTYDFDGNTPVQVVYYARVSDGAFLNSNDVEAIVDTVKIN